MCFIYLYNLRFHQLNSFLDLQQKQMQTKLTPKLYYLPLHLSLTFQRSFLVDTTKN